MGRLLIVLLVVVLIWFLFFRKKKVKNNINKNIESFDMIECQICKNFVSQDEAIFSNGRWYCSKECLINKG